MNIEKKGRSYKGRETKTKAKSRQKTDIPKETKNNSQKKTPKKETRRKNEPELL